MGWSARWFLALALLCQSSQVFAQIYNTGVNAANQVSGAANSTDLHWSLQSFPNPATGPSHCVIETPLAGWVTSTAAQWIAPPASNGSANTSLPLGTYVYQAKFTLPKYVDPASVVITGSVAASGAATFLKTNGTDTGFAGAGTGSLVPFTINHTNGSFHSGDNVLSCYVQNTSGHTGLIVDNLSLTYNLQPAPVITFVSPVYSFFGSSGDPFFLDGAPSVLLNFSVQATNNPTSYQALGLPPGFTINTATGLISGVPTVAESCPAKLTATNSYGFDSKTLNFEISNWSQLSTNITPQAFGNGTYIRVLFNLSYTSPDAINWTAHTINSFNVQSVIFASGLFFAYGDGGIYASADGINWTNRSPGTNGIIAGLAFGNNTFVAAQTELRSGVYVRRILTSSDGQNWNAQELPNPDSARFNDVIFGNNVFLALGEFGIYSSFDNGHTWSLTEHNHVFFTAAFGNGIFLASGLSSVLPEQSGDLVLESSPDGVAWSAPTPFPAIPIFAGNSFVAANSPASRPYVVFSPDGVTWAKSVISQIAVTEFLSVANGRLFAGYPVFSNSPAYSHNLAFPAISNVSFASSFSQIFENAGNLSLTLTRTGDLTGTISLLCDTPPIPNATPLNAFGNSFTAVDGVDFQGIYQTVVFAPGETSKTISIPIIDNTSNADGRREILVELIPGTEGVVVGDLTSVAILDDDKSLQITGADNLLFTDNTNKTVSFSATMEVTNSSAAATHATRIKLMAYPGYNFFGPSFDPAPSLPAATTLGTFTMTSGVSGMSTTAQAVTGIIPAPQLSGNGDIFWWVYAQLEEQIGTTWYPVPGAWPLLDGEILLKSGVSTHPCTTPRCGRDTGGTGGPGPGGAPPLLPPPATLSSLVTSGPDQINTNSSGNGSGQYTALITLSDGSTISSSAAAWSASAFSISSGGLLTVTSARQDTSVTVTGTVTIAGTTRTGTHTVFVHDTAAPVITVPANILAEATAAGGAVVMFSTPTWTDPVDGSGTASTDHNSGATFPIGVTTVICSHTDTRGHIASKSFTITVQDTTAAQITVPTVLPAEATSPGGAMVSFAAPTWTDLVDGSGTATTDHSSGETFPIGPTTVTCSHTDMHGNAASKSFTITVQDTTAPAIAVPAVAPVEATGPGGAVVTFAALTWADAVDGSGTASADHSSGETFPFGVTTVTCSHTDAHNNTGSKTFDITVQDTTPPVITVPANISTAATGPGGAVVTFSTPTWTDAVDGGGTASPDHNSGETFPIGPTTVTCSHTDAHGNTGSKAFTINIIDTALPVLNLPSVPAVEADGPNGAVVTFPVPTATDIVDGAVPVTFDPMFASGSIFPVGATTVNCNATDAHGNTATGSFTVTVTDKIPPVITAPSSLTVLGARAPKGQPMMGMATFNVCASDVVDGVVTRVSANPASGQSVASGTVVQVTATDFAGNVATSSFTVTVVKKLPRTKPPKSLPVVSLMASPVSVSEGQDVTFTFTASFALTVPMTVNYQIANLTAVAGRDYTLSGVGCTPGQLLFVAGTTQGLVKLHARVTPATSGNETLIMTLNPGSNYTVSPAANSANVTISNIP